MTTLASVSLFVMFSKFLTLQEGASMKTVEHNSEKGQVNDPHKAGVQ